MNQRRLGIFQADSNIASHPKIWILIDGTGNQSRDRGISLLIRTENMRESRRKGRSSLNGGEMNLANISTAIQVSDYNESLEVTAYLSSKPKMALLWLAVTHLLTLTTF